MGVKIGDAEVLSATVDWKNEWANSPWLSMELKGKPPGEMVFKKKVLETGAAYFAEHEGWVDFYYEDFRDHSGFGGATIKLKLDDGTVAEVKGPWSSRAGVMNGLGFTPCTDRVRFDGKSSRCITIEKFNEIVEEFLPGLETRWEDSTGEGRLVIVKDQPMNAERKR